ncbi:hypothetical protein HaLaN_25017 [Haematococcus lacustris]|uniref:Uncharacterized protein n=1 Tax=Haematococcus lacustris TaxID=44745 RepID=A0A6A0A3J2_HAELA|nr:hypothetical protein HaLaN_25017 [Haematococcus lacustris]
MNRGGVLLLYIALPQLSLLATFLAEAYEEKDADEEGADHEDEPYTEGTGCCRQYLELVKLQPMCFASLFGTHSEGVNVPHYMKIQVVQQSMLPKKD